MATTLAEIVTIAAATMGTQSEPQPIPTRAPLKVHPSVLSVSGEGEKESPAWRKWALRTSRGPFNETHPKALLAARYVEGFVKRASRNDFRNGRWLILGGRTGCGKTHLAKCVSRWFRDHAFDLWAHFTPAWDRLPSRHFLDWGESNMPDFDFAEAKQQVSAAAVVIIDDLGAEVDRFKSGEAKERLRQILRICETKWMIVTTNVPHEKWSEAFDERDASRMGAAHYVDMRDAEDFRTKFKI